MRTNLIRAVLALAVVLAVSAPVAAQSVDSRQGRGRAG
jgi:hypothetical protein